MYVCMYACMYVCRYVCMYSYIYTYIYVYSIHIHICILSTSMLYLPVILSKPWRSDMANE